MPSLRRLPKAMSLSRLWPLLLALCAGAIPVQAAITFTVSPNVVSNTYNGVVTLQVNGLTNGANNIVVQKFLDADTNGVIDSGDLLVQQFRLAPGQQAVFTNEATMNPVVVTNFMPGDTSATTNQMTIPLNFQNGDFAQTLVGRYLYKISSPSSPAAGAFTNSFAVTNAYFSSLVTGAVLNAASPGFTNIPYAIVLLCANQNGAINVQAGTVANSAGTFSLRAPAGNYFMAAARSNFVEDVSQEGISWSAPSTNNGSVSLNPATTNIIGRIINAANSNGLAGLSGMVISTNSLLAFYFTDTNGNFYAPVVSDLWEAPADPFAAAFQGCLTWNSNLLLNVSNKVVNFTNALPQATAIFYGTVSNSSAVPMPGVYLYASDNQGHQSVGMTDSRGKYVVGVLAGTNQWQFSIQATNNPGLTNTYVFSPGYIQTTQIDPGQAIQQNFSLVKAPYTVSGTVADLDGNLIGGVEVFATNADDQAFSVWTGSGGSYTLYVNPGTWTVGINPASLEDLGYTNLPPNQTVTVTESDVSGVDFSIEVCGEIEILTTNLPNAIVGEPYEAELQAISCQNISNWSTAFGITLTSLFESTNILYTNGTAIYSDSQLIGYLQTEFGVTNAYDPTNKLDQPFFINCSGTARQVGSGWQFDNVSATVNVTGPITNTMTVIINGQAWTASGTTQNGSSYSTTLTCNALPSASGDYYVGNGWLAGVGTLITGGGAGSNRMASVLGAFHSITNAGNSAIAASSIPYTNVDNLVVFIHQGNHVGQYLISAYGPQSTNMDGLGLYPDGSSAATISGTPIGAGTNGGTFNFSVMAEDVFSNVTVQPISIFVFPPTAITASSSAEAGMLQSSNTFQMQLSGLTNTFNYTVLMTTNLPSTNWVPIFTANNPATNSITVPDTAATNATRFYRVQISQ
jgi:hypothetical protein